MKVGIIGAGRIGKVHAKNISMFVPEMEIKTIASPHADEKIVEFAKIHGIKNVTRDAQEIIEDDEIEAVLICSSTDTHSKYIIEAAKSGKHIFCEKPIDYDINRVKEALDEVKKANVKLQIGFCRRFDHNHRAVYDMVKSGKIGEPHIIKITSRDPQPPSIDYVKVSGGLFYDMMIHDFDMARFLSGSEVVEVYAKGGVLIDEKIKEAGDVDTAVVTLTFDNGAIGIIDNSRRAVYGYDQRVEVFCSEGCAINRNDTPDNASVMTKEGLISQTAYQVMWDRYTEAFVNEMKSFVHALDNNKEPSVGGIDGLYPVIIAAAATKSLKENRPVKISEIENTCN